MSHFETLSGTTNGASASKRNSCSVGNVKTDKMKDTIGHSAAVDQKMRLNRAAQSGDMASLMRSQLANRRCSKQLGAEIQ